MSAVEFHSEPDAPAAPGVIEVRVEKATEVDHALGQAIDLVSKAATRHRMGIMVTRVGIGNYIVRAHHEVPYGLVRQRYA